MSASDAALASPAADRSQALFRFGCFALCVANVAYVAASWFNGGFILDALGRGLPVDFVNVWAAGRLVLEGNPAAAYDWDIHKAVENAALGYDFRGYFAWLYPPPFLALAGALALLSYPLGYLAWMAATLPLYLMTIRALVGQRIGWLLAAAFPAVLANMMVGQNGYLTAALIGGTLGFMQRRPVLAGICLGLLTYKPHFGILFPLALIAGRHWTVFVTAAAVGGALALASWLAFGTATWEAFLHSLPLASRSFLSNGESDWSKLQSVFGLARTLGLGEPVAWGLQIATAILVVAAVCALWRARAPYAMKAAALAAATLLATPYIYLYDMVVLAVPVALIAREALATRWRPEEVYGLAAAALLLLSFPLLHVPLGLAATLIVFGLAMARAVRRDEMAAGAAY
jgi:arabinofuranan 3-O-arabinosyltransferase